MEVIFEWGKSRVTENLITRMNKKLDPLIEFKLHERMNKKFEMIVTSYGRNKNLDDEKKQQYKSWRTIHFTCKEFSSTKQKIDIERTSELGKPF